MRPYTFGNTDDKNTLVQGGLEIKVTCDWIERGIIELKGMIEGRYSFKDRMVDDSTTILNEIGAILALPDPIEELEADFETIDIIDDVEDE